MRLAFDTVFKALETQTATMEAVAGVDSWRTETGKKGLLYVAPELAEESPRPPSKANGVFTGGKDSVWHMLHFRLLFPGLKSLQQNAQNNGRLKEIYFDHDRTQHHLGYFSSLKNHLKQMNEWKDRLPEILGNLPDDPDDLSSELSGLLGKEIVRPPNNHIVGRLLQAYYADQTGDYGRFGLDERVQDYIEGGGRNLFERTKMYALNKLDHCPLPMDEHEQIAAQVSASDILSTYSWVASPQVVEMIHPNMQGAASRAAWDLVDFLDDVHNETNAAIDLRSFDIDPKITSALADDTDLLERVGRMSAITDTIEEGSNEALMDIAQQIWTDQQRIVVWGAADRYDPRDEEAALFKMIDQGEHDTAAPA